MNRDSTDSSDFRNSNDSIYTGDFSCLTDNEKFTKSNCTCDFCLSTHLANREWDTFSVTNRLQYRMKKVVSKIEKDYNKH